MITQKRALIFGLSAAVFLIGIIALGQMFVDQDAREIIVIQKLGGALEVETDPGWKWRGWGRVTHYPRRAQFSFSAETNQGQPVDESLQTSFNDGGAIGHISGTVSWTMPLSTDKIIALHKDYGSEAAIDQQLIRVALQKTVFILGPTMSSTESTAEKRPDIPKYMDDQLANGPYLTKTIQQTVKDPITGVDKTVNVATIQLDPTGKPERESASTITKYGIVLQPVSINKINYSETVQKQIDARQKATTDVQISIAAAKKAEQDSITTAKQGEATAAKAKWEQEAVNAKEVALAQKDLQVQTLAAQKAEQFKKEQILTGEGEAARKKLVMEANGALDQKLEAYVKVNAKYAEAIEKAQPGAWTPSVVMAGASGGNGQGANALVDMFTAKTARDLALDFSVQGKAASAKK